jgi:FAD/FMN-containing dehydrogenase
MRAGDEVRNEREGSVAEHTQRRSSAGPATVGPDDPRYGDLVGRGSKRFAGKPDYVRVVCSTEQVVQAVQDAVREQLRVAVRSGGHCLEAFVADPAVRVVIDTSLMTGVEYDPEVGAFVVEAGARLGEVYRKLFLGWGVTIPAGVSPNVALPLLPWVMRAVPVVAGTGRRR